MTPQKSPVVGIPISMTSYAEVIAHLAERPRDRATVVAVCNVHSVMSARRDVGLRAAIEAADIATSDGMPLVWALRHSGRPEQERVYGPILMRRALQESSLRHYFYGSSPETLAALLTAVQRLAPAAEVVGSCSPPFRALTPIEREAAAARILASGADVVWVGLGMPRQELWMHEMRPALPGVALVGVGAAFDFIAGTKPEAPPLLQRFGLEWAFRLAHEPRRLIGRYALNNPGFLLLLTAQLARQRAAQRGAGGGGASSSNTGPSSVK